MNGLAVETLKGHDKVIDESYYRPTDADLLEEYRKALPSLSIPESFGAQRSAERRDGDVDGLKHDYAESEKIYKELDGQLTELGTGLGRIAEFMRHLPGFDESAKGDEEDGTIRLQAFLNVHAAELEAEFERLKRARPGPNSRK
jgi:hypothetical protein